MPRDGCMVEQQQLLSRGGYAIAATRQLLFFHPRLMVRVLEADPAALLEAPLKFAVLLLPDGDVSLRWIDPFASFARYDHPALIDLGRELSSLCEAIATTVLAKHVATSA